MQPRAATLIPIPRSRLWCSRTLFSICIAVGYCAPQAVSAEPARYNVTDLGTVFGTGSNALGLSDSGFVVGWSGDNSNHHAFVWSSGTMVDFGTGGGPTAQFAGVNDAGYAVGATTLANGQEQPFVLVPPTFAVADVNPTVVTASYTALSNTGFVTVAYVDGSINSGGYRGDFPSSDRSDVGLGFHPASAVNERGHFGGTKNGGTFNDPYVWHGGDPLLNGANPSYVSSAGEPGVRGLNDNYQAVIGDNEFGFTDYIWNYRTGGLISLDTGDNRVQWFDINNRGEAVGSSTASSQLPRAMLYHEGTFVGLNSLSNSESWIYLLDARAINDKGWIVGQGALFNGERRAYLAIPEAQPGLINNQDFNRGDLIGWSPKGGGIADSVNLGAGEFAAKLQTWEDPNLLGHHAILDQYLDTFASQNSLDFAYQFRTTTGVLKISLDGVLLATLDAPGAMPGAFQHFHLDLTNPLLQNRTDILLDFDFDGPIGSEIWLDNVALATVPEPSSFALAGIGVVAYTLFIRRRAVRASLSSRIARERY